ncbi:killer cell lectin-like receptor subfamily B member 1C [Aquarana catesbeiana]|uniref:killer cell lectin-like receptor subfamily B member 1C n=1 Tax=Aquarana catesbeiana TaxID=8400 RepID=UPI003CC987FF
MEEDDESARRSAQRAESDSEDVVPGSSFPNVIPISPIYEHLDQKSSVCDNVAPESSSNIFTRFISQHVAFTSSRKNPVAHRTPRYGCLVPALLMVLLLTCITLQSVLIFLRVSGKPREHCATGNSSYSPVSDQTTRGRSSRCPNLWITMNDKCYFISENKKSQLDSGKDCTERGSRLATVKEETIRRLVTVTGKEFWVGLTQYSYDGGLWTGKWPDGSIETLPEGIGTCAKLGSTLTLDNCYAALNYICESDSV